MPLRVSCLGPVLRLACFGGGGGPVPFSPLPGLGLCAPLGAGLRVSGVPTPGRRGGGGGLRAVLPGGAAGGGTVGRGVALPRFVPLPSVGRQQSGCLWRHAGNGGHAPHTAPVRARVLSPGVVFVASLCAGAGACPLRFMREGAAGGVEAQGVTALVCPPPPPGAAVLPGGGQTVPSALGGVAGRRPRGPRVGGGDGGDRGVVALWFSTSLLQGGGLWPPAQTPLRLRRIPPRCTCSAGAVG